MRLAAQIDLSAGFVNGQSSEILAVGFVSNGCSLIPANLAAAASGMLIGYIYGQIFNRVVVPSFVISVAGLLGFLELHLYVRKGVGTINIPFEPPIVWFGQQLLSPSRCPIS